MQAPIDFRSGSVSPLEDHVRWTEVGRQRELKDGDPVISVSPGDVRIAAIEIVALQNEVVELTVATGTQSEVIKSLRSENSRLVQENAMLKQEVDALRARLEERS